MRPKTVAACSVLMALALSAPAVADEPLAHSASAHDAHDTDGAAHDAHDHTDLRTSIGLRAIGGAAFTEHETEGTRGFGLLVEQAFWQHRLELEFVGSYVWRGDDDSGIVGEAVLQFPRHLSNVFTIYAGVGGLVEHVGHHSAAGLVLDAGTKAWVAQRFGLGLEVDYLVVGTHAEQGVEGIAQLLVRF